MSDVANLNVHPSNLTNVVDVLEGDLATLRAENEKLRGVLGLLRQHADEKDREVGYAMADRCGHEVIDERRFKADGFREALRVADRYVARLADERSNGR